MSSRFLCYPGSETTKGVIYYCVRVVYAREVCAPNAVPPAFLCATYNRGRCSVFLHITVYNMHIVLEACSPSASVSGVWVYLRRKKKKACILALYVSGISQQQLVFCSKKAKMLKSKQSCFSFCPVYKCVTKMLIMTVLRLYQCAESCGWEMRLCLSPDKRLDFVFPLHNAKRGN